MQPIIQNVNLRKLFSGDPILNFLADGGSWADAIEMEYKLAIPIWEAKLKATFGQFTSESEEERARLLRQLENAYSFLGQPGRARVRVAEFYREYVILNIPIWEGQLRGAVGRKGPSAERHKARLLEHLREAYGFLGQPGRELEMLALFQREYEAEQAAKGKEKAGRGGASKPKATTNNWAALADSEED